MSVYRNKAYVIQKVLNLNYQKEKEKEKKKESIWINESLNNMRVYKTTNCQHFYDVIGNIIHTLLK